MQLYMLTRVHADTINCYFEFNVCVGAPQQSEAVVLLSIYRIIHKSLWDF